MVFSSNRYIKVFPTNSYTQHNIIMSLKINNWLLFGIHNMISVYMNEDAGTASLIKIPCTKIWEFYNICLPPKSILVWCYVIEWWLYIWGSVNKSVTSGISRRLTERTTLLLSVDSCQNLNKLRHSLCLTARQIFWWPQQIKFSGRGNKIEKL